MVKRKTALFVIAVLVVGISAIIAAFMLPKSSDGNLLPNNEPSSVNLSSESEIMNESIEMPEEEVQNKKETLSAIGKWKPSLKDTFQIQFVGDIDFSINATIMEMDMYDGKQEDIERLHIQGKKVACYINVGAWEDWRPDKNDFPESIIGKDYEGWPGEKWADIRSATMKSILEKRFDLAKSKDCDIIEPDNLDSYNQDTGFDITSDDELEFERWLANEAHKRGMEIVQKNDPSHADDLAKTYDLALVESCHEYSECEDFLPYILDKKPVFVIEYDGAAFNEACKTAQGFYFILKNMNLDSFIRTC